jgi:hypothetical protein
VLRSAATWLLVQGLLLCAGFTAARFLAFAETNGDNCVTWPKTGAKTEASRSIVMKANFPKERVEGPVRLTAESGTLEEYGFAKYYTR